MNLLPDAGLHIVSEGITPPVAIGSSYDTILPSSEDVVCTTSNTDKNLGIIFSAANSAAANSAAAASAAAASAAAASAAVIPSMFTSDNNSLLIGIPPWSGQSVYVFT